VDYGYARCSTNETKQDIARQKRDLIDMGAKELYFEYESGTKTDRPELTKLLRHIKPGDSLYVTEISRITRSTKQLCEVIDFAIKNNIRLVIGSFIVDCTGGIDAMTEGMIKMMGVFSELERNMTIERIKSGLKNSKAKGVRLGRPPLQAADLPKKFLEYYELYTTGHVNKNELARLCKVSRTTIYKWLNVLTGCTV